MECYLLFIGVNVVDQIILKLCVPLCMNYLYFLFFHWCIFIKTSTSPIYDIRTFVDLTDSILSFRDVVKRPFKGFVFYHKVEKKEKKHDRISTPSNHLALYSYIDDKYSSQNCMVLYSPHIS